MAIVFMKWSGSKPDKVTTLRRLSVFGRTEEKQSSGDDDNLSEGV